MSIWIWILFLVGSLIVGAVLTAFIYLTINFVKDFMRRKAMGLPKDKKKVSEFIKLNEKEFLTKEPTKISEKEAQENERRKREQFREFEKLRRLGNSKEDSPRKRESNNDSKGDAKLQSGKLFPDEFDKYPARAYPGYDDSKREIRLD